MRADCVSAHQVAAKAAASKNGREVSQESSGWSIDFNWQSGIYRASNNAALVALYRQHVHHQCEKDDHQAQQDQGDARAQLLLRATAAMNHG